MDSQTVGLLTVTLKGTLHPFALSFPLLENPVILLNGRATLSHFPLR